MSDQAYDRAAEDFGNIVNLGHVNVCVPNQRDATAFYISALGLTRDPYLMTGTNNMWVNVGVSPVPSSDRRAAGRARSHGTRHP